MLTKDHRQRYDIPHEPGEWLELRPLPWPLLAEAAAKLQRDQAAEANKLLDSMLSPEDRRAAMDKAMSQRNGTAERQAPTDPAAIWDRRIVLRAGIVAWSYGEFEPDLVDDLDEATAKWAFETILKPAMRTERERLDALVPFSTT